MTIAKEIILDELNERKSIVVRWGIQGTFAGTSARLKTNFEYLQMINYVTSDGTKDK